MAFDVSDLSSGEFNLDDELDLEDAHYATREHYIPIRKADLVKQLANLDCLNEKDSERFLSFCAKLDVAVHQAYHSKLRKLRSVYAAFDPDADTRDCGSFSSELRDELSPKFFDAFTRLIMRANYRQLSQEEIEGTLHAASDWGVNLHVDFDVFERLDIYARGDIVAKRKKKLWYRFYREEEAEVPIYQRLVIVFRINDKLPLDENVDTESICIKLFKNIPKMDVDMLLPGSQIRMNWLDKVKIIVPSLTGICISLFKFLKLLAILTTFGLVGLVGGTLGYGVKSFFGYLSTKDKYQLNLTRSLYYQNLDNNAGVIFRILSDAEDQDLREIFLAYFILWKQAPAEGLTARKLDYKIEALVYQLAEVDVDFEIHDAIHKLLQWKLVEKTENDRYRAVDIQLAEANLSTLLNEPTAQ